ncbi:hypothetical protein [Streptomyces sp. H27-H5]|uniref:hypothetical protein n=1 Tax=Streptomyces sp. H27-H5 TaxID=2996460 RepID=UPI002270E78F|nr:hypothetical protein [Streptomyces sp. H27-H5]MCY0957279.1 hypothetical protein [Streptomyces sp. H27-H5]
MTEKNTSCRWSEMSLSEMSRRVAPSLPPFQRAVLASVLRSREARTGAATTSRAS